jgi:aminoglycoside phosphotransferase (APT) family kinase protein
VTGPVDSRWAEVVARVEPGGRFVRSWEPAGGLSRAMTILEVDRADGSRCRLAVRRARDDLPGRQSLSVAEEHDLLSHLHAHGVAVPAPRLLDDAGTLLGTPCSVLDYVDGAPRVGADAGDGPRAGRTFAAHLASIHRLDAGAVATAGIDLPRQADVVARSLADAPADLDHRLREGAIREVLRTRPPRGHERPPRLLHGDFWPGNLIWRGDDIVAVIDWEDAALGDPLADVATTRLDLAWGFGPEATAAFTDHYFSLMPVDAADLPIWDLVAALRPAGSLAAWAADWADFGRPDVTEETMRAAHTRFVDAALAALGAA